MNDLDAIRAGLRGIDQRVAAGQYARARPWGGAGVVVTETGLPADRHRDFYSSPRAIVTPYVETLSWLFEQLWEVFARPRRLGWSRAAAPPGS
ncbi:hypothetical protein GA0070624_3181 [Micromonospora rhizosphaerae]|uniref:Uncharacterized protein n=1 Tax=Micromonospora rhizosphaerae TaxID=568872 RepID=A0A1C6S8K9_9ACTN|nr:hypothetical protein [Micromonospora rhizosphaerae]SCL25806.1 hypothetical protein GA0070624_3181 [Micromonospora rhizosphaerae]